MAMVMSIFQTAEAADRALDLLQQRGWVRAGLGQRTADHDLVRVAVSVADDRLMDVTEVLRESGALQVHIAREVR